MKESDLYNPVKNYFSGLGFDVKGEVCGCDLVALKDDHLIIIELKLNFNIKLLYQATRRLSSTPYVYVAIAKPTTRQKMSFWTMIKSLSRRLHIGLIIVDQDSIKILNEPGKFTAKNSMKNRRTIINEFNGRKVALNTGGITGIKLETAYLEKAVHVAVILAKQKKSSASDLIKKGAPDNTYKILYQNHYNWFEKIEKGIYKNKKGSKSEIIKKYKHIWNYYSELIQ